VHAGRGFTFHALPQRQAGLISSLLPPLFFPALFPARKNTARNFTIFADL
jgi:hypothetical protein